MDQDLEIDFFNFIKKDNIIFLEDSKYEDSKFNFIEIHELNELTSENIKKYGILYICDKEVGKDIFKNYTNKLDIPTYDICSSLDVIEFLRTYVRQKNKEISRGRLYFQPSYYNKEGRLIYKDQNLDKLYQKLCRWIRKKIPKTEFNLKGNIQKEYISKSFIELVEKDKYIVL
ncbi:MAG: hypothetical protein SOV25_01570 [Candidatus Onthovivens sp.]|nr:hypothetical protein [Candidatus Onthovivens sp.]